MIPGDSVLAFQSGTGEVEARLDVNDRIAVGTLDLVAEEVVLKTRDVPLYGDLEVHAILAEGNLPTKEFDLSGTTIRLDDIVGEDLTAKQERKLEAWYCDVELQKGSVTIGKPMEADGQVRLKMYDTRPVVAMLREFGTGPKWLALMPNVKEVDGTMNVGFGKERMTVDDLVLNGEKLEVLGWLHILNKKTNGRLFIKYGIMAAGVALDGGKGKVYVAKPRKWFEEQQSPQQ
jgi:translocation and assembly module TamB